jgi:hypothetical protein
MVRTLLKQTWKKGNPSWSPPNLEFFCRGIALIMLSQELRSFLEPFHTLKLRVFDELLKEPLFCQKPGDESSLEDERHLIAKQLRRATEIGLTFANPAFSDVTVKEELKAVFSAIRELRPMWSLALGLHMMFAGVVESLGTEKHAAFFKVRPLDFFCVFSDLE